MTRKGEEGRRLELFLAVGYRGYFLLLESKWGRELDDFRQRGEEWDVEVTGMGRNEQRGARGGYKKCHPI